jgi:hypothetical protein
MDFRERYPGVFKSQGGRKPRRENVMTTILVLNIGDSHEVKVELEYVPTTEYMFFKRIRGQT